MGRTKKKWIDKKHAQTFTLTSREYDTDEEEERKRAATAGPSAGFGPGVPLDGLDAEFAEMLGMYEDQQYEITDERRKEMLALGLPDDGYDYLRHLRSLAPRPPPQGTSRSKGPLVTDAPASLQTEADHQGSSLGVGEEDEAESEAHTGHTGPSVVLAAPRWQPPREDIAFVDARALTLSGTVEDESQADAESSRVSALSRATHAAAPSKGRLARELAELEAAMRQAERLGQEEEEQQAAAAAATSSKQVLGGGILLREPEREVEAPSTSQPHKQTPAGPRVMAALAPGDSDEGGDDVEVDGDQWGDWLDEFVATAAKPEEGEEQGPGAAAGQIPLSRRLRQGGMDEGAEEEEAGGSGADDSDFEFDKEEEEEGRAGSHAGAGKGPGSIASESRGGARQRGGRAASIASSYWRPERSDRRGALDVIDARFDKLTAQYEDDELGDLEEDGQAAAAARGAADISAFSSVLDEFLREKADVDARARAQQGEAGGHVDSEEEEEECEGYEDMAEEEYEALRAAHARKSAAARGMQGLGSKKVESLDEVDHEALAATKARLEASLAAEELQGGEHKEMEEVVVGRGQRWDCESVLSLRSNISNHPSRIIEPQKRAGNKGGGVIVMSEKTGAPKLLPPGAGARGLFGLGGPAAIAEEGEGDDDDDSAASSSTAGPEGTIGGATVIITERRKGETAEEKKARKASVKEARKASRAAKKELKGLFKQEAGRQKRQAAGRAAAGGGVGLGSSTFVIA